MVHERLAMDVHVEGEDVEEVDLMCKPSGVDFISILQAAFTCADPKSAKRLMA